jgi:hypothetical protein
MGISMTSAHNAGNIRELTVDELNDVSGGFKVSAFGVTLRASAEFLGVSVSIEGVGGLSVSEQGISATDGKGNIVNVPWSH